MAQIYTGTDNGSGLLKVTEQDGTPFVSNVNEIKVSNTTLTDDGGGVVSITTGGGGGGGVTTFAGGTTGLTPAAATAGAVSLAGTLVVFNGGTGLNVIPQGAILTSTATDTLSATAGTADRELMAYETGTDLFEKKVLSTGSSGLAYGAVGGLTSITLTRNTAGLPPQYATGDNTAVLFQDWGGTGQDLSGSILTDLSGQLMPNAQLAGRITQSSNTTSTSGTPLLYNLTAGDVAPAGGTGLTLAIFGAGGGAVSSVVPTPIPDNFNTGTGYGAGDVITIPQASIPGGTADLIITLQAADFAGTGAQGIYMGGYNSGGVIADMGKGSIVSLDGSVTVTPVNGLSNRSEGQIQLSVAGSTFDGSIADTQIAFGTAVDTIGGNAGFTFNAADATVALTANSAASAGLTILNGGAGAPQLTIGDSTINDAGSIMDIVGNTNVRIRPGTTPTVGNDKTVSIELKDSAGVVKEYMTALTSTVQKELSFNNDAADIDFRVESVAQTEAFKIDAAGETASFGVPVALAAGINSYAGAAPTNGQLLIGDTATGLFDAATLTEGANITITNAAGAITIAAAGGGGGGVITGTANGANNRITTYSAATTLNGEANLTFDGTQLSVIGDFSATGNVDLGDATTDEIGFYGTAGQTRQTIEAAAAIPGVDPAVGGQLASVDGLIFWANSVNDALVAIGLFNN